MLPRCPSHRNKIHACSTYPDRGKRKTVLAATWGGVRQHARLIYDVANAWSENHCTSLALDQVQNSRQEEERMRRLTHIPTQKQREKKHTQKPVVMSLCTFILQLNLDEMQNHSAAAEKTQIVTWPDFGEDIKLHPNIQSTISSIHKTWREKKQQKTTCRYSAQTEMKKTELKEEGKKCHGKIWAKAKPCTKYKETVVWTFYREKSKSPRRDQQSSPTVLVSTESIAKRDFLWWELYTH